MHISNPLEMNDWPIKRFLVVVLSVQLALWGVIGWEALSLQIPLVRQIVGFAYLSFVPGVVILRILKLHNRGSIETLLYSVGLSLATVMFTGLAINTFYPSFGILEPISFMSLMISFTALVSVLCVIAYVRDRSFSAPTYLDTKWLPLSPLLFLMLILLTSILGTQLVNFSDNNVLLMVLIVLIGVTVLLIGFNKFIPSHLYPMAIFIIALSLLFYRSLISNYVSGFDTHEEYYVANLVKTTGNWNPAVPIVVNSMLSLTMLAPTISDVASLGITWVFKVVYPLLFSLIPLGLFRVFRKQTDERIAFLSCFFFVAVSGYYVKMAVALRQQIAMFFLLLLTLLMIDKQMSGTRRSFLFIIFGASLAVSHYGLSYIYIAYLVFAWIASVLLDNQSIQKIRDKLFTRLGSQNNEQPAGNPDSLNAASFGITSTFIEFFVVVAIIWYMLTSDSSPFNSFVSMGNDIISNFIADFMDPRASHGLAVLLTKSKPGLLHMTNTAINYLNQIFIIIGVVMLIWKYRELKFWREYAIFSVFSLTIIFAGVFVPVLTMRFDIERLYHIALIFLAPFFVIGALAVIKSIERVFEVLCKRINVRTLVKTAGSSILSVYLVVFFLYQTGFIWELADRSYSQSVSLSHKSIKKYGSVQSKVYLYGAVTPEQDVFSAIWLLGYKNPEGKVYATYNDFQVHPLTSYGMNYSMNPVTNVPTMTRRTGAVAEGAYVYLQYLNVVEGIATEYAPSSILAVRTIYDMKELSPLFAGKNLIYTNGGSEIYK